MVDRNLVSFLIQNHSQIVGEPLSGQLREIFIMFKSKSAADAKNLLMDFDDFNDELNNIAFLAKGSLVFEMNSALKGGGRRIELIDEHLLRLLELRLISESDLENNTVKTASEVRKSKKGKVLAGVSTRKGDLLSCLTALVDLNDTDIVDVDNDVWNTVLRKRINNALSIKSGATMLGKERAKQITLKKEVIPTCNDKAHITMLSTALNIVNNRIVSIQWLKVQKCESQNFGFTKCVQSKIHYVPNLKPQTDVNLGDCSYLDTCHKLSTCRYVHYLQFVLESLVTKVEQETKIANQTIVKNKKIPFYTHGECCSSSFKFQLPSQWIRCDVRKFDFKVLGKFSAVIADPAWNIHMNLPYGTCNDVELLELPLHELQDEGILFLWVTGRAIELGKESLQNWGYKVVNEISWIKTNQLGRTIVTGRTGHWLNHSKEHLLVGLKGNPKWLNKNIDIDMIVSTTRETSRKPDELYGLVERMVGPHARKLEIFGRDHNVRPGWFTIGNQISGNCIHELDVKKKHDAMLVEYGQKKTLSTSSRSKAGGQQYDMATGVVGQSTSGLSKGMSDMYISGRA